MARTSDKQRRFVKMYQDLLGITFEMKDGTKLEMTAQEILDLLTFVVELKKGSEKRRREILGD